MGTDPVVEKGAITDDKKWVDGDFEVITVDKVRFRVPFYYLFAASPVFRDACNFDTKTTEPHSNIKYRVTLLDPEFEGSGVFRAFLQMLAEGKLPDLFNPGEKYLTRTVSRYRKLFKFAAKWQCTAVTLLLQQSLYKMIHQSAGGPLVAFVFGTVINDLDLCATSLKFPMAKYDPEGKGVEQFVFDTSFWPNWAWDICTTPLTAALAQAWVATAGNRSLLSAKFSEKLLTFRAEKLRRDKGHPV